MANRTSYKALAFNRGELKQIESAAAADAGITATDLTDAELNAKRRVDQFILKAAGPIKAASIVSEFLDDTNDLDPIIIHLAELIASADILEQWERYNHADEGADGQNQRKDPDMVRGRATRIVEDIISAGGTFKSDGSFRRWFYPKGQQGIRVSGPGASGSRHDHRGYKNVWGELLPGPIDPYDQAKR